ncbi:MAG: RNA methyltransferase [Candidatus Mcinerneyibacterium aminivorans]|uniref:tRNA (guanosine(18)-2'-O)-methyltransferase n=1 Tax=Candidatus Mcinerneyibacterium aminivorans TaxID=2703815 RepID=A0A5D0MEL0_9BACT|nr:MAG: RNA methyltransferase [Candidatus Mcinerneyibacterium aminivorans]
MDFEKYSKYITDRRYSKLLNILNKRSDYFTFVFENFYDSHNICAGLRSIEGFGFQDVHVIEGKNKFEISKGITQGAHKWLTINKYDTVNKCKNELQKRGYKFYIAEPNDEYPPLDRMEFKNEAAFLFGQEGYGVSDAARELADGFFYIPINGFVESFNVSVTVAITAYILRNFLESKLKEDKWLLSEDKKDRVLEDWFKKENSIKKILRAKNKI